MESFDVDAFLSSIGEGNWFAVVGFGLMLLIFLVRSLVMRIISKRDLDLVAAALGVVSMVATGLVASGGDSGQAIRAVVSGLVVGATAVGFWQLLGKRVESWVVNRRENSKSADDEETP